MLTVFHGLTYMNRILLSSFALAATLYSVDAKAGVMVSASIKIDKSGHLLDGATITFNGTTGPQWLFGGGGYTTLNYTSASITFSAPGTVYDGNTFTPLVGQNPWIQSRRTAADQHWLVLTTAGSAPVSFSDGTNTIRFTARFDGLAQDAVAGDTVVDSDFSDHFFGPSPSINILKLTHIAGPDSFGALDASAASLVGSSPSGSNVVPEPASLGIFAMLFGTAALRRRRA